MLFNQQLSIRQTPFLWHAGCAHQGFKAQRGGECQHCPLKFESLIRIEHN